MYSVSYGQKSEGQKSKNNSEIQKSRTDLKKGAIRCFYLENKIVLIGINDEVALFSETILNIMSNFIPNETIIFDDSHPPWRNKNITNMINYKNYVF